MIPLIKPGGAVQTNETTSVIHPGPVDCPSVEPARATDQVRREAIRNLADFLFRGAQMAEETGTVLCVENLFHTPGFVIPSYAELSELVEAVGSPAVQITLDTGHADRSDGLGQALDAFAPYLRHMHVHDSDGSKDHYEVGRGKLDFSKYARQLAAYPFTMAIEARDDDDPEGCVLRSRDRLRDLPGVSAR